MNDGLLEAVKVVQTVGNVAEDGEMMGFRYLFFFVGITKVAV